MTGGITYKDAGVDISTADETKRSMAKDLESRNPRVLNTVGAFASLYDGRFEEYKHPVLVLKMEEPGSKQLLAFQHGHAESIAHDLINHLINDVVVMGAKPHAVLDCIICGKLEREVVLKLVKGMADACRAEGCDLVGGETSEQPRVIPSGAYILAASCLGVVDKEKIVDGSKIEAGHVVLGVASNGLHTNGYTLVRTLLDKNPGLAEEQVDGITFIEYVLKPHLCYNGPIQELLRSQDVRGLAHITGGGIIGNLNRILPKHLAAAIDLAKIKILPIFKRIRELSKNSDADMLQTYNLGVGLTVVVPQAAVAGAQQVFSRLGHEAYPIGEITSGQGEVQYRGKLSW